MTDYGKHFSTRATPQSQPIPGTDQVANSAGGFAWQIDDWQQLDRFLILGTSGGTYYIDEATLTIDNAEAVVRCIKEDGQRVVNRVVEISEAGRAPKNDAALFVLAMCSSPDLADLETRQLAMSVLPRVARIGTHLFQFLDYVMSFGGWRRSLRTGVGSWYTGKDPERLAYQLVKYPHRGNWHQHDVLNQAHPKSPTRMHAQLYDWIVTGKTNDDILEIPIIEGFLKIRDTVDATQAARLIREYNLPREVVPTLFLKEKVVWDALLNAGVGMPMTALIRNLGNMGKVGLLTPMTDAVATVVDMLGNSERLKAARVHPIQLLSALVTYGSGRGYRGSGQWPVVPQIVDALDGAFYESFQFVEATGKRHLLGLDVSSSMGTGISALPQMSCAMGTAAMALVTARTEPNYQMMAFSTQFVEFPVSAKTRLDDAMRMASAMNFGGTDCALPMIYAEQHNIPVDVFIVYTDSETWYDSMTPGAHPAQRLRDYRQKTGIDAKLAVVAMEANRFSIADPDDAGMLDFVGFSTDTPQALAQFTMM